MYCKYTTGDHPWWPAKLLKVGKDRNPLEVQFFGEFSSAEVTYTNCMLYSLEDPNKWCGDIKKKEFYKSIHVSVTLSSINIKTNNNRTLFGKIGVMVQTNDHKID